MPSGSIISMYIHGSFLHGSRWIHTNEKVNEMSGNVTAKSQIYDDYQIDDDTGELHTGGQFVRLYGEALNGLYIESYDEPYEEPYEEPYDGPDDESYGESDEESYDNGAGEETYGEPDAGLYAGSGGTPYAGPDDESYGESDEDLYFGPDTAPGGDPYDSGEEDAPVQRISLPAKILTAVNIVITLSLSLYFVVVFTEFPFISEARDLWIETAMTTADHQWLATGFLPQQLIDRVMSKQVVTDETTLSNPNLLHPGIVRDAVQAPNGTAGGDDKIPSGIDPGSYDDSEHSGLKADQNSRDSGATGSGTIGDPQLSSNGMDYAFIPGRDITIRSPGSEFPGWNFYGAFDYVAEDNLYPSVGDTDEHGNTIIVSDEEEDIIIVEIRKTGYTGRIMIVPDPSRVVVRNTRKKNVQGELIKSFLNEYDAIAGMNGNGFDDPEGHGRGGSIIGWSVSDGVAWGQGSKSAYASVGLNDQHILMVGIIKDFEKHNIRDLAQYGPTLIVDGKKLISGSGGWGIQPRSAIGQREDGTILMATFDGRQPGYSLGITAGEVADILYQYGCVNAGLCDGGSSSIMMYDGAVLGKPSTPMKDTGRYLPNAFLVLRNNTAEQIAAAEDNAGAGETPKGKASET